MTRGAGRGLLACSSRGGFGWRRGGSIDPEDDVRGGGVAVTVAGVGIEAIDTGRGRGFDLHVMRGRVQDRVGMGGRLRAECRRRVCLFWLHH